LTPLLQVNVYITVSATATTYACVEKILDLSNGTPTEYVS